MATEKEYQGFATYETWVIALWIGQDRGLYETVREMSAAVKAKKSTRHRDKSTRSGAEIALADAIQSLIEELQPDLEGMWADLMSGALSEVNWYQIAERYLELGD